MGCIVGGLYTCQNGGACQTTGYCVCAFGYQGTTCQTCKLKNMNSSIKGNII